MSTLRNLTIVVEHDGKLIPVNEVDGDISASDLLVALADKINLPQGTKGILTRKRTHKQILPAQSLHSAGVEDSDTLIAAFERTAGYIF